MKLRIDFRVQETECPPEEARGVSFGDEVDVKSIFDFFNRCRDAVLTLFNQPVAKDPFADERKRLEAEIAKLRVELKNRDLDEQRRKQREMMPDPGRRIPGPYEVDRRDNRRWMKEFLSGDDGSRGGDGPPVNDPVWRAANGLPMDHD